MNEQDRDFMVEWLAMRGYNREFYEKMHIKELEIYYLDELEEIED